ncbi:MAG: bifunctional hydroxymethylpyrimidine kinase/phosphomethylpyrimidine kinase [Pseudomonadota bacterium]
MTQGRVLIVAGSDSGGGAGIQADIKAVSMLGGYAMTAVTALTAQNTRGVFGVHAAPPDFIAQQMRLCLDDIGADAIKTGMLHSVEVIATVAGVLADYPDIPVVCDPVMVAKGGHPLLEAEAEAALLAHMLPRAAVLTPNLPEAARLLGQDAVASNDDAFIAAAEGLRAKGAAAVLLKGGHAEGPELRDLLLSADGPRWFTADRIDTPHTHGTGCTLASAVAAGLAQGMALGDAVERATAYVHKAIATAPGFGGGHGPLNHGWPLSA